MATWKTKIPNSGTYVFVDTDGDIPDKATHRCIYKDANGTEQEVPDEPWIWDGAAVPKGAFPGTLVPRETKPTGSHAEVV